MKLEELRRVGSRSEILDTAMEEGSVMVGGMGEAMGEGLVEVIAVVMVGVTGVMVDMVGTIMVEEGTEETTMVAGATGMTMVDMEDMEMTMVDMEDMVTTTREGW